MPTGIPKTKVDFNTGSNFDRTGQWVIAKYMDSTWVTGTIQDSRVKYGGKIQHSIISDSPTHVALGEGKDEIRDSGTTFLVEEYNLTVAKKEF